MHSPLSRRAFLGTGLSLPALAPGAAMAQAYPDRSLRLIVPFTPGGTVDLVGRLVGNKLSQNIGQPIVIENRGGAGGGIGSVATARSAPDGYTFMVGSTSTVSILPQINSQAGYDPERDFTALSQAAYVPHVLVINTDIPARNLTELVAWAKQDGRGLAMGSSIGTPHHLAAELLHQSTGVEVIHVPFRGGGETHAALVSGTIQASFVELSVAAPHMASGRLRAVAIASRERVPSQPDLPTIIEQGYPNFEITSWFGFFLPKATPAGISARLGEEVIKATRDPEVTERLTTVGATVVASRPPEFEQFIQRERAKWAVAIRALNITDRS
ncbi:tripartite tricarboxylate transporter substrate binding protein [Rhodovarius crocodyli]|uniref:Tripartite tricarboxylate transporter substrate binding protein n=1 Tax=Rhodovarius crocodyli TaxID=1979269 RepID=A0A437M355_9PROT|nr:tripartite tricarboxylate transporter substrate binding protein [Rhodovarius crocodyli]RVT91985.1 tripartite tricarboxylate transporter substrate binding protein [Rhodovarius crocodyli]